MCAERGGRACSDLGWCCKRTCPGARPRASGPASVSLWLKGEHWAGGATKPPNWDPAALTLLPHHSLHSRNGRPPAVSHVHSAALKSCTLLPPTPRHGPQPGFSGTDARCPGEQAPGSTAYGLPDNSGRKRLEVRAAQDPRVPCSTWEPPGTSRRLSSLRAPVFQPLGAGRRDGGALCAALHVACDRPITHLGEGGPRETGQAVGRSQGGSQEGVRSGGLRSGGTCDGLWGHHSHRRSRRRAGPRPVQRQEFWGWEEGRVAILTEAGAEGT